MTNYYNPTQNAPVSTTTSTYGNTARKPSEKHYSMYVKMCSERGITPRMINEFSPRALFDEVAKIKELPFLATQAQKEQVFRLLEEINSIKPTYKMPSEKYYNKLTAEKASLQITQLRELRKTLNEIAPPSEGQIDTITSWKVCPDIPWEEYKVDNIVYLDKLTSYSTGETERSVGANELWEGWSYKPMALSGNKEIDVYDRPWRAKTMEEFRESIKSAFTQSTAYEFIGKYGSVFYEWRQTRITDTQIQRLRQLEERLYTMASGKQIIQAIDLEGELLDIETSTSKERKANVLPYEPMSDEDLKLLPKSIGTDLIHKIEWEIRDRESVRFGDKVHGTDQQDFQDKIQNFDDRYGKGRAKDQLTAKAREYRSMTDFVHRLATVVGYRDDELLDKMKEHHVDFTNEDLKISIKSYMWVSLDTSNEEALTKTVARLYAFTEESQVLTNIVDELKEELKNHKEDDGELELEMIIG